MSAVLCQFEDVQQAALDIAAETGEVCIVYKLGDTWGLGGYMLRTMTRAMDAGAPEDATEIGRAGYCDIKGPFWSSLQ